MLGTEGTRMDELQRFDQLVEHVRRLPPERAAAAVHAYFATVRPDSAEALVRLRSDQVGELDGAPVKLRYPANRRRLVRDRDALQAKVDTGGSSRHDRKRLRTLEDMLKPVQELGTDDEGRLAVVLRERQFLSLGIEGDGRLAEVFGDLEQAKHVAVLVPGMLIDLDDQADQAVRARNVHVEAGPDSAVVTWLGYDTPDEVLTASSSALAREAAEYLYRCTAGLDVIRRPDSDLTALGHSFGSLVVARAAYYGARFDNGILCGSPGIAPDVRRAADLRSPRTKWFTARAPWDYVAYTQWHGPDPATWPDATRIATTGVRFHDKYHGPNTEFLRNTGRIIRGEHHMVTTTDTTPGRETRLLVPGLSWGPAVQRPRGSGRSGPRRRRAARRGAAAAPGADRDQAYRRGAVAPA